MVQTSPISVQQRFWNKWNATTRESDVQDVSLRQAHVVTGWLQRLGRTDLDILDVGCGTGWLSPSLTPFGSVTATDLSDEVLKRAQQRLPDVTFIAGDFMELEFGSYDVVVTLEVLSHVADQPAFIRKLARHLRPGGYLMMATQNRPVLQRFNDIPPPAPGQLRSWVDKTQLRTLLAPSFEIVELFTATPKANKGLMRWVNSQKLNRPVKALFGERLESVKEAMGLGWTLMVLARKPMRS